MNGVCSCIYKCIYIYNYIYKYIYIQNIHIYTFVCLSAMTLKPLSGTIELHAALLSLHWVMYVLPSAHLWSEPMLNPKHIENGEATQARYRIEPGMLNP